MYELCDKIWYMWNIDIDKEFSDNNIWESYMFCSNKNSVLLKNGMNSLA
jgi:hypothetical protein